MVKISAHSDELCLRYGIPVLLTGLTASYLYVAVFETAWWDVFAAFIVSSMVPAGAIFALRSATRGLDETLNGKELGVAGISALGLSLPIALMGIYMDGILSEEYGQDLIPGDNVEAGIQRTVTELELSQDTRERSMELLEQLRDMDLARGRNAGELTGGIVYLASREMDEPRTLDEISKVTGVEKRRIGKTYRFVARNLDLKIVPPDPGEYVDRFADDLGLSDEVKETAHDMIDRAREIDFTSGKSPTGIAASAIFLSAYIHGERRTLNETSDMLDVTTITIRERAKDFIRGLGIEEYPEHLKEGSED